MARTHERLCKEAYGFEDHNLCFDIADQHAHQGTPLMNTINETLQTRRGVADQHKIIGVPQDSNTDPIAQNHPLVRAVGVKIVKQPINIKAKKGGAKRTPLLETRL
jgi:hypothetical protein